MRTSSSGNNILDAFYTVPGAQRPDAMLTLSGALLNYSHLEHSIRSLRSRYCIEGVKYIIATQALRFDPYRVPTHPSHNSRNVCTTGLPEELPSVQILSLS